MVKIIGTGCVAAAMALAGCVKGNGVNFNDDMWKTNGGARFLCVGMENSARFGACPGCELDAMRLERLMMEQFGYLGCSLISASATKAEVVKRLKSGIEATGPDQLFLFFYSGHGGQEYLGGKEPDGADRMDEFLCLYDTYMLDDEIWEIVSKCRGRVFLYFDACHSATMYRSVKADSKATHAITGASGTVCEAMAMENMTTTKGFTFRPEKFVNASAMSSDGKEGALRMLCWSGCREQEYSYGGSSGGTMTSAVLYRWDRGIGYQSLWDKAVKLIKMSQPTQNPVQTTIGGGFGADVEAFR